MTEPTWLTRDEIEFIHQHTIEMAGGSHGLRDPGLLDSALARPRSLYAYGEVDRFELAASYAEAISRNHPFVDGNKRVAFGASTMFLFDNGFDLLPGRGDEHADMMERLAQGKITRNDAARHFRRCSRPSERAKAGQLAEGLTPDAPNQDGDG